MSGTPFPPDGPTTVQKTIPQYLYSQYFDDDDLQAFVAAFNQLAQDRIDWLNDINLPIYTGPLIKDALLDIVAEGIYGLKRPTLPYGSIQTIGPLNTWAPNTPQITPNGSIVVSTLNVFTTTDDIFKRIITWSFFKGDGKYFCIKWLKRRVMRFLIGVAGTAPNIDETYPVSVTFGSDFHEATITVDVSVSGPFSLSIANVFQAAVLSLAIPLPFQWTWNVVIVNLGTGLANNGGVLQLADSSGWPLTDPGTPGLPWSNGGIVNISPGATYNPLSAPLFFSFVTSAQLLALNLGAVLPTTSPASGSGQLWNNGNEVQIA